MKYCIAAVGSMTSALKGQKALSAAAINSTIIKLNNKNTNRGCAYGLEFEYTQYYRVQSVLKSSGISVTEYISGGAYM